MKLQNPAVPGAGGRIKSLRCETDERFPNDQCTARAHTLNTGKKKVKAVRGRVLTHHSTIPGARAQRTICDCNCAGCGQNANTTEATHAAKATLFGDLLELHEMHLLFILS